MTPRGYHPSHARTPNRCQFEVPNVGGHTALQLLRHALREIIEAIAGRCVVSQVVRQCRPDEHRHTCLLCEWWQLLHKAQELRGRA